MNSNRPDLNDPNEVRRNSTTDRSDRLNTKATERSLSNVIWLVILFVALIFIFYYFFMFTPVVTETVGPNGTTATTTTAAPGTAVVPNGSTVPAREPANVVNPPVTGQTSTTTTNTTNP